jgi:hypothetical protein
MAIFVFILGLLLTVLGCGALIASVNLVPTDMGILYAGCGAVAASSGLIVVSIGALISRVDALADAFSIPSPEPAPFETLALEPEPPFAPEPVPPEEASEPIAERSAASAEERVENEPIADRSAASAEERVENEPINENRAGRLPTLAEVEHAIIEPGAPPTLVGRYTAGGAHYMIFSDGTIEAETEQGAFRFASMGDFKAYIAGRGSNDAAAG